MIKFAQMVFAASALWAQASVEGTWQGSLDTGAVQLRLAVHVSRGPGGDYSSTLDSLDQGAMAIPVEKTEVTGNTLRLDIPRIRASFTGTLSSDASSIGGKFTQGLALPLVLHRVDKVKEPARPQNPKPP